MCIRDRIGIIDHSNPVNMLRTTASVICKIRIKHYPDVRTWDGSWKLDGSYRLDATQENSARAHYLFSIKNREQIKSPHVYDIPGLSLIHIFGVYTAERQPIVSGVKVVPKWPLTHCYPGSGLPDGSFGVITDKAEVGRGDFLDNTALFVYIPNACLLYTS